MLKQQSDQLDDLELKEKLIEELKPDLNNFLFSRLPSHMSLGDFERLAYSAYDLIMEAWDDSKRKENP